MRGSKIIVVEDESIVAEDIRRKLKNLGYEVPALANSGVEAVAAAERLKPDLVLMDISLRGELDGISAAAQLRSRFDTAIVFLTAHADTQTFEKAKSTVPYGYIIKPFDDRMLEITVEMALYKQSTERKLRENQELFRARLTEIVEERTLELKNAINLLTREVAARKAAEEILKENESKFRTLSQEFNALLDAIPDVILLLEPDLKIAWANKSAAKEFSAELSELTGRSCYQLWRGRSEPCDGCHVLRTFENGAAAEEERKSLDGRILDSRSYPITDANGRVRNAILIVSDITERAAMQAEAIRTSHLASLGELAAGIAHEINNPINGIINYAQIISNGSPKGSKENEVAGRIIREGNRISGIVRGLLSFARERREEKLLCDIGGILQDTIDISGAQVRKDGIRITVSFDGSIPGVIANPQQLQQVFLNLISNSRYALNRRFPAGHKDKKIEISVKRVVIDGSPLLRIVFADRGCGIPPIILGKVLDPFFSTKPSGEGTGLGLSISHGLIKSHGGRLSVESEEGLFTNVVIELPAQD